MATQITRKSNKDRRAGSTQAVESAAARLFVERGYRATSIDLIAREVQLTKGSVYFYFKDKETLLLRLLAKSEAHFFAHIFEKIDGHDGDPGKQVEVFLDNMIRAGVEIDKHLLLLPVLMSIEFKGKEGRVELRTREIYDHLYNKLEEIIKVGQASRVFSRVESPRALVTMFVAMTDGLLLEIYRGSSGVEGKIIGQTARASIEAILHSNVTNSEG